MAISLGWLLKILDAFLPLGNMFFGLGSFGLILLFLPMLAVTHFRTTAKPLSEKLRFVSGISSVVIIGISILARLMHLPGADVIFTFGFLPFLYFTLYKKSVTNS